MRTISPTWSGLCWSENLNNSNTCNSTTTFACFRNCSAAKVYCALPNETEFSSFCYSLNMWLFQRNQSDFKMAEGDERIVKSFEGGWGLFSVNTQGSMDIPAFFSLALLAVVCLPNHGFSVLTITQTKIHQIHLLSLWLKVIGFYQCLSNFWTAPESD